MKPDNEQSAKEKKRLTAVTGIAIVVLAVLVVAGGFILNKLNQSAAGIGAPSQEQFAGQAETSQQLQTECQNSALTLARNESLQTKVDEYKKHVENCREVYFTLEEKASVRSEGMYADLIVDLISKAAVTNLKEAGELLSFAKTLPPWQYYMGPIVCDSKAVLSAIEESIAYKENKICVKKEEFNEKIVSQLKIRNFQVLEQTMPVSSLAWLGSPEADMGCPVKISNILKTAKLATENGAEVKENISETSEQNQLSVVFRSKQDEDKLVLDFTEENSCVRLKSALVSGLQTNE